MQNTWNVSVENHFKWTVNEMHCHLTLSMATQLFSRLDLRHSKVVVPLDPLLLALTVLLVIEPVFCQVYYVKKLDRSNWIERITPPHYTKWIWKWKISTDCTSSTIPKILESQEDIEKVQTSSEHQNNSTTWLNNWINLKKKRKEKKSIM